MCIHIVSLHKVVEVREGQRTYMFEKFPYEQAESQSFSLIYEQEGRYIPMVKVVADHGFIPLLSITNKDKRYAHLTALNVVCFHEKTYNTWMNAVCNSMHLATPL